MSDCDTLGHEKVILSDDLTDSRYHNQILNIRVDTLTDELGAVQEELSLATVDRLKLKDKWRQVSKHAGIMHTHKHQKHPNNNHQGVKSLQRDLKKLKHDLSTFESSHKGLLEEIGELGRQLVVAENNLANVGYFKVTVERHLRQCKDRNTRLESHLRVIYNDLVEMESHHTSSTKKTPRRSAKVLLETLELHHYFASMEDDLRDVREQNRSLAEDQQDLKERCNALEQEKQVNYASSEYIQDSMVGQHTYIAQLQKEKQQLVYEKERLQTKLSLSKNDKERMLDNMQRLSRSLGSTTRYNRELEAKLQSFKVDLSDMENRAFAHSESRNKHGAKGYDQLDSGVGGRSSSGDFLCPNCRDSVNKKFLGISKNTQLLGDELLDCIVDNMSLETAIFSFLEEKTFLEHEMHHLEGESFGYTSTNNNAHNDLRTNSLQRSRAYSQFSNYSETNNAPGWSGSQLSIESTDQSPTSSSVRKWRARTDREESLAKFLTHVHDPAIPYIKIWTQSSSRY